MFPDALKKGRTSSFSEGFCSLHTRYLTMSAANTGTIIGTVVSDITTKKPSEALEVVQFRVAPLDARDDDSPIPMVAYNGAGTNITQRYNKGDTLAFTYRLRYTTWQSPEGEPRGRMEVVVTSTTAVRLGQISTSQRAQRAIENSSQEAELAPV